MSLVYGFHLGSLGVFVFCELLCLSLLALLKPSVAHGGHI